MHADFDARRRRALAGGGRLAAAGLLAVAPLARATLDDPTVVRASRALMGTRVGVVVQSRDRALAEYAIAAAYAEMTRLERLMSRYRPDSETSALASAAGRGMVPVSPETLDVLERARAASIVTEGAFDVTVGAYAGWSFDPAAPRLPGRAELERERDLVGWRDLAIDEASGRAGLKRAGMRVDLGGVAKLPILDAGRRALARHGLHDSLVDGGGDVIASGRLHGRDWRVGVRDPRDPSRLVGTLAVSDAVVASSGDYERCFERDGRRFHHVLDPRTGRPAQGVRGVAMVARSVDEVAALGASVMAAGPEAGLRLLHARRDVDALLVDASGRAWTSGAMARRLAG
jgi:thiamine biosynthesis lipoprotein